MKDHYLTIKSSSEGLYKEKGSKFISFAFPVSSEDEIKDILDMLRKKYHDARHHCFAWKLGMNDDNVRANDDGEPSNTAGKPILGVIRSKKITNILIVVIRYFGGTLLGVGGLIRAYKFAAESALNNVEIIKKYLYLYYEIRFKYEDMNIVMRILKDLDIEQYDQMFKINCQLKAKVKKKNNTIFMNAFKPYPEITIKMIYEE